ncbi:glycosyltransferase family 2 protein [Nitrosopumilus sp.]|uniref:glycosyltransferase family 2 protein n=1 Tax=Nitrosopumilus sp. TaxID=2024843 RepID=UPI00247C7EA3|nr:glycosyltransferase family 2 protein [Nitrosopumilus sp.]MCV0430401.1 glycosyltransferase family 2 protein [Nitrosopumilus sp.]
MKLVILMLAYNEEERIEKTILRIPRKIPNIDQVEILVVNDGSTDNTVDMAMNAGADKIISHKTNLGVGAGFMTGIRNSISLGADIVVTVDADGEANIDQIPDLINPIINNQFDVVVGTRFWKGNPSTYKKLNYFGNQIFTKLVSFVAGHKFTDTQTGFRAYSKDAIENITVVNNFTYTQEVLLDLHFKKFRIGETPISFKHREDSRLVHSITRYTLRSLSIISSTLVYHRPIMAFGLFGALLSSIGIISKLISSIPNFIEINSTLSSGLILLGAVSFMIGLFAHIVFKRQAFSEKDLLERIKRLEKFKE